MKVIKVTSVEELIDSVRKHNGNYWLNGKMKISCADEPRMLCVGWTCSHTNTTWLMPIYFFRKFTEKYQPELLYSRKAKNKFAKMLSTIYSSYLPNGKIDNLSSDLLLLINNKK